MTLDKVAPIRVARPLNFIELLERSRFDRTRPFDREIRTSDPRSALHAQNGLLREGRDAIVVQTEMSECWR